MSARAGAGRLAEHELALVRERQRMFETLLANLPGLAYRSACDAR